MRSHMYFLAFLIITTIIISSSCKKEDNDKEVNTGTITDIEGNT